ncbi:hypothetical protein KO561_16825 [Radiobacillus kanasensis]|uniref:hypothetical protein n=1 Tax=Radiobacillus kanasensis TaxID=2844358 RepID=UPI001E5EA2A5|nr:hypothetical protein [Radiobacillus kanasensis]UFT98839.1 hypothetical protein KO561_16825 [Radiobacillus kanasensis]
MSIKNIIQNSQMPIIVSLPDNRWDLAEAAINAGADGLKFHINVDHHASGNHFKSLDDYTELFKKVREEFAGPMGIVIGDVIDEVDQISTNKLKQIGFDYFSLYAKDIPSKMVLQNDIEKTVAIDHSYAPSDIRNVEEFGIEAIELSIVNKANYGERLNFADMLAYKNYRNDTRLPLIVPSQKRLVPDDLTILNQIGINAVMLGAVTVGSTTESIYSTVSEFHNYIEKIALTQG